MRPSHACMALTVATMAMATAITPSRLNAQAPTPGTPKPYTLPAHRTFTLRNGLKVTFVHYGSVPKAVVSLAIATGAIDEPPFGPGLAALTTDLLLEGTIMHSSQQLSREAADMGGSIGATAGAVQSTVGGEVLSAHAAKFVALVSDVAHHPRFEKADFERVRQNALRNLAMTMQQAGDQARQRWRGLLFPDHPFGRPYSTEATLQALEIGHVRNFFDDNFGAVRAHLYVSGVFDDAAVEKAARESFSDWDAGTPAKDRPAVGSTRRQLALEDRPGAPQSTIWIGLPVIGPSNPDFTKLEVTDALLGGAFGSRITANIREDKGYTYSPNSMLWQHRDASYWVETADVTTQDTGNSLKEILREVERLRAEAPPAAELDGIKQNLIGLFVMQNSSRAGVVSRLQYLDEFRLGDLHLTGYVQRVLAVTPQDVRRMAQEQLDPAHMTITVIGDKMSVQSQLAPFR